MGLTANLFDQRDQYQTHECITDTVVAHNVLNLFDEEHSYQGNARYSNDQCNDAFREGELVFAHVTFAVGVLFLFFLEEIFVNAVMGTQIEENIARLASANKAQTSIEPANIHSKRNNKTHCRSSAYAQNPAGGLRRVQYALRVTGL